MAKMNRKSGMATGPIMAYGPMVAKGWRGLQILSCPTPEINMTITSRLKETNNNLTEGAQNFKRMPLKLRGVWNVAAAALGSASEQESRDNVSYRGAVIRPRRGVVMSGIAYYQRCLSHRKTAHFSDEYNNQLLPPAISPPSPAHPEGCRYDPNLEGMVLDIEEPALPTYNEALKTLEEMKEHIKDIIKEFANVYDKSQIDFLYQQLERQEQIIKEASQKKKPTDPKYDEQCVIIESSFTHVLTSPGIITWRLPLPFANPLKNPDGALALGQMGRPVTRLVFTHLPTCLRKPFPSGYVKVADLSDAVIKFAAETIIALDKTSGAVASVPSHIVGDKTPTNTKPEAEQIYRRLRDMNKQQVKSRRLSKVTYTEISQDIDNQKPPPPTVIEKNN